MPKMQQTRSTMMRCLKCQHVAPAGVLRVSGNHENCRFCGGPVAYIDSQDAQELIRVKNAERARG